MAEEIASPLFGAAVLVSADEAHARTDRRFLRQLCANAPTVYARGADALEHLERDPPDVVLCDAHLADMTGREFLRLVRRQGRHRALPVVMVTSERDHEAVLDAFMAGCAGYVLRPYCQDSFERHFRRATRLSVPQAEARRQVAERLAAVPAEPAGARSGRAETAAAPTAPADPAGAEGRPVRRSRRQALRERVAAERRAWETADLPRPPLAESESRRLFEAGRERLGRGEWGDAIESFRQATQADPLFAEAWEGLAEAWEGQGDARRGLVCLKKAAAAHARFDRFERTQELFRDIARREPSAENPYAELGRTLAARRDHAGAAHALGQALRLEPDEPGPALRLAEAVLALGDELAARDLVASCLVRHPGLAQAPGEPLTTLARRLGVDLSRPVSRLPRWLHALVEPWREPESLFKRARGRLRQEIDQAWLFEGRMRDFAAPSALSPIL